MAEEGVYKAEVIYVQDPEELGETLKNTTKTEVSIFCQNFEKSYWSNAFARSNLEMKDCL